MLSFPLVSNELLRQGRHPSTFGTRLALIGIVFVPLFILWGLDLNYGMVSDLLAPMRVGKGLGFGAFAIQFIAAFGITSLLASSALTQEKEDRTLGLLVMADLRGWDIVLSKFVGIMLRVGILILGSMPFLGFASLFGGIHLANSLVVTLVLYICAGTVCAIGIFFSTMLRRSSLAGSLTILTLFIYVSVIAIIELDLLTGGIHLAVLHIIPFAFDFGLNRGAGHVFMQALPGLVPVVLLGAMFLVGAVIQLPSKVHESVRRPSFMKLGARRSSLRFWRTDPLVRLVNSCVGSISLAGSNIALRVLAFLGVASVVSFPVIGWAFVMVVIFREIILSMERMGAQGTLDDLVLVPHSDTELGRAFWWGHVGAAKVYAVLLMLSFIPAYFFWEIEKPFLYALFPVVIAQFLAAIAVACLSGTFQARVGAVGAYILLLILLLGYLIPPFVVAWWKRGTMSFREVWRNFVGEEYQILYDHLGRDSLLVVFAITNVALSLLVTVAACWALGRRLRHRPLFERIDGAGS